MKKPPPTPAPTYGTRESIEKRLANVEEYDFGVWPEQDSACHGCQAVLRLVEEMWAFIKADDGEDLTAGLTDRPRRKGKGRR